MLNRRKKFKVYTNLMMLAAAALGTSCNRGNDAVDDQLRSIDNLSGIRFQPNSCGPDATLAEQKYKDELNSLLQQGATQLSGPSASYIIASNEQLRRVVASTLLAVPQHILLSLLAAPLHTQVIVDDSLVTQHCHQSTTSRAQRYFFAEGGQVEPMACWHKQGGDRMKIYVRQDEAAIRHSLVRIFAYAFVEYLVPEFLKQRNEYQVDELGASFIASLDHIQAAKYELAKTFLTELSASGLSSNEAALNALNHQDSTAFANMVYAETVDSHHCDAATFTKFYQDFSKTWTVYQREVDGHSLYNGFGNAWHQSK